MKLKYNAPVTMTFGLICAAVMALDLYIAPDFAMNHFLAHGESFDPKETWHFLGMILHIFAHDSWDHLLQNFLYILLLGPVLEEKYGSRTIALLMGGTALFTGILNYLLLQPTSILGASGIVFMMILLVSFSGIQKGEIPLTLLVVALLYPIKEIVLTLQTPESGVSLIAHVAGGVFGTIFGFIRHLENGNKRKAPPPASEATVAN